MFQRGHFPAFLESLKCVIQQFLQSCAPKLPTNSVKDTPLFVQFLVTIKAKKLEFV